MIRKIVIPFAFLVGIYCNLTLTNAAAETVAFSSLESYKYPQKYHNIALSNNQSTAIVIIAYNRPYYLKKLIESLEENPESQTLPFYFILDGGSRATQSENCAVINTSKIKHKEIILRERNYGYAKTIIDTNRFIFDWCKFDKMIFMEEDLIVSPYYIRLLLALHKWAKENYSNVGVVQTYSFCFLSKEEKRQKLNLVQPSGFYWWSFVSYCIDKEVWDDIKAVLYEYESRFVDAIPQTDEFFKERSRPSLWTGANDIRKWLRTLLKTRLPLKISDKKLFVDNKVDIRPKLDANNFEPNGDLMFGFALWMKHYVKIKTTVNRAKHIGEVGITFDHHFYQEMKHNKINLDNFEEDAILSNFEVNT